MQRISESLGYQSTLLLTKEATSRRVTAAIKAAAKADGGR